MPTPDAWRDAAAATLRRDQTIRADEEGASWVSSRLSDPVFRSGWNSALWEVRKAQLDGLLITGEFLKDLAR